MGDSVTKQRNIVLAHGLAVRTIRYNRTGVQPRVPVGGTGDRPLMMVVIGHHLQIIHTLKQFNIACKLDSQFNKQTLKTLINSEFVQVMVEIQDRAFP